VQASLRGTTGTTAKNQLKDQGPQSLHSFSTFCGFVIGIQEQGACTREQQEDR